MGTVLFIISFILYWLIVPVSFIFTVLFYVFTFRIRKLDRFLYLCAISKDQTGGVFAQMFLNKFVKKSYGYKFGNPDETISSALGKNKKFGTLTVFGTYLDKILNLLDPGHSYRSIEEDENNK